MNFWVTLALCTAAGAMLSGCTQADGNPDFTNPDDPDNLVFYDDEFASIAAVSAIAFIGMFLLVLPLHQRKVTA